MYQVKRNMLKSLLNSYELDRYPFCTDPKVAFPDRFAGFEVIGKLRELLFPCYWNKGVITQTKNVTVLELHLNEFGAILFRELSAYCPQEMDINKIVDDIIDQLPQMREILKKDAEATYFGDPAAQSYTEIIRAYPGFNALLVQRLAHQLYRHHVPVYPREITEFMHSKTGIDIHPGAVLGKYFFIDHGSGVVIGETTEIGDWVRIYQGVTLGVLHFEKENEKEHILKKGYKRHPSIGSHVVIGAGTKILGSVRIGNHVNIGANSWIQEDIPDGTTVYISEHPKLVLKQRR